MTLYTFYCCVLDGSTPTRESREFKTDEAAIAHCEVLLKGNDSFSHIIVANRERDIATVSRESEPLPTPVVPFEDASLPSALRNALERPEIERSGVALIATTLDGTIAYWNDAATALYGWSSEATMGLSILDITPALQAKEQAAEAMQQVHGGQTWEGEIVLRQRDGTPFRAFVIDVPVAAGPGYIIGASAPSAQRKKVRSLKPLLLAALAGQDAGESAPA